MKVRIESDMPGVNNTKLFIDDVEIHGVRSVKFEHRAGETGLLTVEYVGRLEPQSTLPRPSNEPVLDNGGIGWRQEG